MNHRGFTEDYESDQVSDFTLDKILDDVYNFQQELKLNTVILLGHSIHAFMAVAYAKKYPECVARVIMIAQAPFIGAKLHEAADDYFNNKADDNRKRALKQNLENTDLSCVSFVGRMLAMTPMLWYDYTYDAAYLWGGGMKPRGHVCGLWTYISRLLNI